MIRARPAIVGIFILGALTLGAAAIAFFGGSRLFAPTLRAVVFFDGSLAGLDVGAPVTFRGVRIGAVQRIVVNFSGQTMTAQIPVFLEIDPARITWHGLNLRHNPKAYEGLIDAGLRAQLALRSVVTGQLNVDLDFRPGTPAHVTGAIPGVAEIPTVPSDLEQLREQVTGLPIKELADTAQRTLTAVDKLATHVDGTLDPLTDSARRTADEATRTLETTRTAVLQVQANATTTLQQLNALASDSRLQVNKRANDLSRTLATADRAGREAQTLLTSLNSMTAPRSRFRGDLESTARDLADSAGSLRNFARLIERNPSALLTGRTR